MTAKETMQRLIDDGVIEDHNREAWQHCAQAEEAFLYAGQEAGDEARQHHRPKGSVDLKRNDADEIGLLREYVQRTYEALEATKGALGDVPERLLFLYLGYHAAKIQSNQDYLIDPVADEIKMVLRQRNT